MANTNRHLDRHHTPHCKPLNKEERRLVRAFLAGAHSEEVCEMLFNEPASELRKAYKRRGSTASAATSIRATLRRLRLGAVVWLREGSPGSGRFA